MADGSSQREGRTVTCYNCDRRAIGCHSTCDEYMAMVEENEKLKQSKRQTGAEAYFGKRATAIWEEKHGRKRGQR